MHHKVDRVRLDDHRRVAGLLTFLGSYPTDGDVAFQFSEGSSACFIRNTTGLSMFGSVNVM